MKCSLPPAGFDSPLGEPNQFSLTRSIVQKRKQARAAAISQLKGAVDGIPVSSLTAISGWLPSLTIWQRARMGDSVAQMEISHGDWN